MKYTKFLCGTLILSCGLLTACGQNVSVPDETREIVVLNQNGYIDLNNADKGERETFTSKDKKYTYCENSIDGITILSDKSNTSGEFTVPSEIDGKIITKIGNSVYKGRGFTTVNIPDTIKIIDDMAFMDCVNLQTLNFGANVVEVRECAFQNCYNLSNVNLNDGLFRLGKAAFAATYDLKTIKLPDSISKIDSYCFTNSGLTSVNIPTSLIIVSPGVFMGCSDLKSVSQPGTVYMFEDCAFKDCENLTITIPSTCEKACLTAFENVKKVDIDEGIYYFPEELSYDGDFSEFENPDIIRYYYNYTETETE